MPHFGLILSLGLVLAVAHGNIQGNNEDDYLNKIDPELLSLGSGSESVSRTILVTVRDDTKTVEMKNTLFNRLESSSVASQAERGRRLVNLKQTLDSIHSASQKGVMSFLEKKMNDREGQQLDVEALWITNKIIVRSADSNLVHGLARLQDVQSVDADKILELYDPIPSASEQPFSPTLVQNRVQWGVQRVDAPTQWYYGNEGQGVVVGVMDTGVRGSHEALRSNYKNDYYSWFDPIKSTQTPTDVDGHGTHCAGSVLGSAQGIGVARKAQWIACRGCYGKACSGSHTLKCGQFMACPTTADGSYEDCTQAPHIVSCSWGGDNPGTNSFYDDVIRVWRSAGIIPVFAIGNDGRKGCSTTGYPGDHKDVIAIGSSAFDSNIAPGSSLGPTRSDGRIKPDFAAPGVQIYSAAHTSDTSYVVNSGTSMAAPHASGIIALMLSKAWSNNQNLSYNQIRAALVQGSQRAVPSSGRAFGNCGNRAETQYPNNHAGYGILNATRAINSLNR